MKLYKTLKFTYLTLFMLSFFSIQSSFAQIVLPDDPDAEEIPIDGGVSLLAAAGLAYGVKKVRDTKRKK